MRYANQKIDEETVKPTMPELSEAQKRGDARYRANRRLYGGRLLEDVDQVVGGNATPEVYSAMVIALALYDLELEVNI